MLKRIAVWVFVLVSLNLYGQGAADPMPDSLVRILKGSQSSREQVYALFSLAEYYIFRPGEIREDLSRADMYLEQVAPKIKNESVEIQGFYLLLRSFLARERHQYKAGKELAIRSIDILGKGTNKIYLGRGYWGLSEYYKYDIEGELVEKIRLVELACQAYAQTEDKIRYANTLMFLADLCLLNQERIRSEKLLNQALNIYTSKGYTRLSGIYVLYSRVYEEEGNFEKSLQYCSLAIKDAKAANDTGMALCQIYNRTGMTLMKLKEYANAMPYFQDAFGISQKNDDISALLYITHNIVVCYLNENKPKEALQFLKKISAKYAAQVPGDKAGILLFSYMKIYLSMRKYALAELYGNQILTFIKKHPPALIDLHNFYASLVKIYLETNQYNSAVFFIAQLDSLAQKSRKPARIATILDLRFRLDTALRNYKAAVANLIDYQKISDSIFNEESIRQIKQLEIEYETEKARNDLKIRDQDILVLKQRNELQKTTTNRANLARNFTIAGAIVSILVSIAFYRQYRLKQKRSAIIARQNEQLHQMVSEKEWLVREIHDRVKNNFHIVASLLDIQSSYLKNEAALSAVRETQSRIHSMSLIHQKLYQTDKFSLVYMPEYLCEIVDYLRDSFGMREQVKFHLEIGQIKLNHAIAITLGLIVNEAVTNSIKYAFKNVEVGEILLSLKHITPSELELNIFDNGIGIQTDFSGSMGGSMGMDLLYGLTNDIGGSLTIVSDNGTRISIVFKLPDGA